MTTGIVFDIKRFSIHDGPGIRTTVFFKGCGMRCRWCHNPESQAPEPQLMLRPKLCIACAACVDVCAQDAISRQGDVIITDMSKCISCGACIEVCYSGAREMVGRENTVDEIMTEIEKDRVFYDESGGGVTFSGGEPTMQPEFLLELLRECKRRGIHTVVDTCGLASEQVMNVLRPYVDLFLYDLKLMDDTQHRHYTGVSNELVLHNLRMLSKNGHNIIVRAPIIPGINDYDENIRQMGKFIAALPHVQHVEIMSYHTIGIDKHQRIGQLSPMPKISPPSEEKMRQIARLLSDFELNIKMLE